MKFTDLFIRRPVLASVVSLLILVLGLRAITALELRQYPETENTKVIVGGNPFNIASGLWKNVGADAYAGNAQEAVAVANLICASSVTA